MKLSEVKPTQGNGQYCQFVTEKNIDKIMDYPVREAARLLYDLNMETTGSACNRDAPQRCFLTVNYETLSEENKKTADLLAEKGALIKTNARLDGKGRKISNAAVTAMLENNADSDVDEIISRFVEIFKHFQLQDVLHHRHDVEKMKANGYLDENGELSFDAGKWVKDKETGDYFEGKELLKKHVKFVRSNKSELLNKAKAAVRRNQACLVRPAPKKDASKTMGR